MARLTARGIIEGAKRAEAAPRNRGTTPTSDVLVTALKREVFALRNEVERLSSYRKLAYRDCLTGLYNRRYLEERLSDEHERTSRMADYRYSIILIDVDDFKLINDTQGHCIGDQVLMSVAHFLSENLRKMDLCCRLGGDEFAIVLPATTPNDAQEVLKRLREGLERANTQFSVPVQLSMGTSCSDDFSSPEDVIAAADTAMYQNKRSHKTPHWNCLNN